MRASIDTIISQYHPWKKCRVVISEHIYALCRSMYRILGHRDFPARGATA